MKMFRKLKKHESFISTLKINAIIIPVDASDSWQHHYVIRLRYNSPNDAQTHVVQGWCALPLNNRTSSSHLLFVLTKYILTILFNSVLKSFIDTKLRSKSQKYYYCSNLHLKIPIPYSRISALYTSLKLNNVLFNLSVMLPRQLLQELPSQFSCLNTRATLRNTIISNIRMPYPLQFPKACTFSTTV